MGKKTVEAMALQYGTRPEDLICGIGPSICGTCYEVSQDVAEEFVHNFPKSDTSVFLKEKKEKASKYLLDLWKANYINLLDEDISKDNIYHSNFCSSCNVDTLFSYRKENGTKNRMIASIMLKK